jgi:hypothetical protein
MKHGDAGRWFQSGGLWNEVSDMASHRFEKRWVNAHATPKDHYLGHDDGSNGSNSKGGPLPL